MGSNKAAPQAVNPNDYLFGSQGGNITNMFGMPMGKVGGRQGIFDKGLYDQFVNQAKTGLSPEEKAMLEGKAGGMLRSGEQGLREQFAGSGAPIGAQVGANIALRGNNQKNLMQSLYEGNLASKQQGFGNMMNVLGLGQQGANFLSEYGLKKTEMDNQPSFWEQAIGSLLSMGGQGLGAYLGKKWA